jgi:hypothetical protein
LLTLLPLHPPKPRASIIHIKDGIHSLEHSITVDIHIHGPPALNTSIHIAITRVRETEILLLECHHCAADGKLDLWQIVRGGGSREDVALVVLVVGGTGDGFVDGFDEGVVDEAESGARVHDGGVTGTGDGLAVDGGRCGLELPETLAVIDFSVVGLASARGLQDVLVDEAEGVEALADC